MNRLLPFAVLFTACATTHTMSNDELVEAANATKAEAKPGASASESGEKPALTPMQANMQAMMEQAARQAQLVREAQTACEMEIADRLSAPQLILLSRERTANFLKDTGAPLDDAKAIAALTRIGTSVAGGADVHFGLVASDKPRAFSASDGTVLVTTALLKKCANEAQLAAVLAHEVDHVVKRADEAPRVKSLRAQCQATRVMKEVAPAMANGMSALPPVTGSIELMLRGGEPEADEAALRAVAAAGYEPAEYEALISALGDTNQDGITSPGSAARRVAVIKQQRETLKLKTGKKPALPKTLSAL